MSNSQVQDIKRILNGNPGIFFARLPIRTLYDIQKSFENGSNPFELQIKNSIREKKNNLIKNPDECIEEHVCKGKYKDFLNYKELIKPCNEKCYTNSFRETMTDDEKKSYYRESLNLRTVKEKKDRDFVKGLIKAYIEDNERTQSKKEYLIDQAQNFFGDYNSIVLLDQEIESFLKIISHPDIDLELFSEIFAAGFENFIPKRKILNFYFEVDLVYYFFSHLKREDCLIQALHWTLRELKKKGYFLPNFQNTLMNWRKNRRSLKYSQRWRNLAEQYNFDIPTNFYQSAEIKNKNGSKKTSTSNSNTQSSQTSNQNFNYFGFM